MQSRVRRKTALLMVAVIACAFSVGVFHLLTMRFDAGDVYPVYSSLRPDPLGAMALFEGLESIEGMAVSRNLKPLEMMPGPGRATVLHLGLQADLMNRMGKEEARALSILAMEGARVVFALRPERAQADKAFDRFPWATDAETREDPADDREETEEEDGQAEEEEPTEKERPLPFYESFRVHIGVVNAGDVEPGDGEVPVARRVHAGETLPSTLPWHSAAYIDEAGPMWETVYALGGRPVAVQRKLGKGRVVIITDAYHVTNEALMNAREPGLLAWLVGPNPEVIFEESHLGLSERPGVAALGRKYRLHWFALSLLVLALLFVWRNATSLVPPDGDTRHGGTVMSGKDHASGMVSLMRRNVAPSRLMHICIGEWKRSFLKKGGGRESDAARADALLRDGGRAGPVELYGKLDKILNERKRTWTTARRG